ncbi:MAG TPA: AAA family ATPase [Polyangiaceae bacterium]|nr:AAA family ATPase [Polyangiaceae bacterium]
MYVEGYQLVETISRSGRSHVCRARRTADGASVVIKSVASEQPDPEDLAKLEFEFRILRKLDAPGVLRALALVRGAGNVALIVEDFGGQPPAHVAGSEALDVFFTVATAIARTLGTIHAQNIIHKDVKPRNILINPRTREVKLIDFNTAIERSHEHQDSDRPRAQQGSLAYMSPEQTGRMNRDLDYRADYYSLGVTCFELLTGTLPFSASDAMGWVHCHLSKPAPDARSVNPAIPEPVAQIVRKLMAKDPDDRYQSARGLLLDLERCQREWQATRAIAPFALGAHDVSERFQISKKLFGRDPDIEVLLGSFEAASAGAGKLLLVSGYSGVGKSSLINEIQRVIVRARGHFIAGKFNQLERNVPYGALLQALRGFVKQLLAEPDDRVQAWRKRLSSALGMQAKVLVDLVPELERLLGKTPAPPELDAQEARLRVQRVFRDFIKCIAQPEHPLVIFIDDLQWTDASTLELLSTLLSDDSVRHVLVIGAYRDNEVNEGHLLSIALKAIEAARAGAIARLHLLPLSEQSVQALVADTLHCEPQQSAPLAQLVFNKTAGNPFFVNELLHLLHRDGAFRFDAGRGLWQWDLGKIQSASISDNIVELMVARLRSLPAQTLEQLCTAACLGGRFELTKLAHVADRPLHAVAAALREAVLVDILIPFGDGYRLLGEDSEGAIGSSVAFDVRYEFQHDRVRQAAYQLLEEQERTRLHLRIGKLDLAALRASGQEENIFEVVNHLNLGRELITARDERAELSRLNASAGQRARRSAAYSVAVAYFEQSLALLSPAEKQASPEAFFECSRALVECVWLTGDVERANSLADALIEAAPNKVARGSAVELKVSVLEFEGRMVDAVRTIRAQLPAFGIELPEEPAEIDRRVGEGIAKMQAHLARVAVEDLPLLPELDDPDLLTAMSLLLQIIPSAIQTYPPLFILAELTMFDITLTHGKTAVSCKNFVDCGIIQGGVLGDYETAYRLGKAAFAALEQYAPIPLESAVHFVFGAFISHWRAPVREGLEAFARALRAGIDLGDPRHATFSHVHTMQRKLLIGVNLHELSAEFAEVIAYLEESRAANALVGARAAERVASRLRDSSLSAHPSDAFTAALTAFGNAQWVYSYGQAEMMASVVLGDSRAAQEWLEFTQPMVGAGVGLFSFADYHLFEALILADGIATRTGAEREATLAKLLENQEKLRIWAHNCPANFAHKYQLCCAEIARVRAAPSDEVLGLYDEAIASAGDDFVQFRALANERLAQCWSDKQKPKIARAFIEEARYLYELWGARAKVRQLELRYPEWLAPVDAGGPRTTARRSTTRDGWTGALDLESIIKATQAISSEVKIDKLFTKLMATLIENAGAEQGSLVLIADANQELTVVARAHVAREIPDAARAIPVDDSSELCSEIVRYVARTSDTVVLDNATADAAYADYDYIRRNAVKSLLCMPIRNQGKLVAILYAENNATTRAFTAERLSLLQVIGSQAAISLTNAQLYDKLEEKVTERTLELREKNREVRAMLNSMQQGIFTVAENLIIQPEYSAYLERILERRDIAGKDCLEVLFEGSNLGVDALAATRTALVVSFGGESFFAQMNASHLIQEFQKRDEHGEIRYFEVDWNPIPDEDDLVRKFLVALRDVSLVRQLKETVAANSRELSMLGQVLDAGVEPFQRFCSSARALLAQIEVAIKASLLEPGSLEVCFRNMHTIKGNARMLGLSELVDAAHLAEEAYAQLRSDPTKAPDLSELAAGQLAVRSAVEDYERVFRLKLGDVTRGSTARAERTLTEIRALLKDATSGTSAPTQVLRALERLLIRADAVSLDEVVKGSARMLASLASELGKATPIVECEADGLLLSADWADVMRDVLPHAFRNSLDHGIEAEEERKRRGKPVQGRIRLRAERLGSHVVIRFADDGRGLGLSALRERAGVAAASDDEVAKTVFLSGVSTVATLSRTSGRGVGMDAIRAFVRQRGGGVSIAFTGQGEGDYRPFELVLELPEDAQVAPSSGNTQ